MPDQREAGSSIANATFVVLIAAALLSIQALIGGTRMIFALPAYALVALAGVAAATRVRSALPRPDFFCIVATLLFIGYIEARGFLSPDLHLAQSDIYSALAGLILYLVIATAFTSSKARLALSAVLLTAALAHVAIAAIQFRNGDNFMPIPQLQRYDYGSRGSGFYICPNHLAGLLEVLGLFGLSFVCWSRWPAWGKLLAGYATVMCYAGVVLTGSRGGYLSSAASLAVFAIFSLVLLRASEAGAAWKLAAFAAIAAAIFLGAIAFAIAKSHDLSERAANVVDNKNVRLELWAAAIKQWQLAPVLGTGSGTYLVYGRKFRSPTMQRDPIYAHDDYLQLLAEYGLVGAALFALFLAAHLRSGLRAFARVGPRRLASSVHVASNALALNVAAVSAVAAYAVHSVFDFNLHIPANLLLMAFVFGVLANSGVARERDLQRPSTADRIVRLTPALLGVGLAIAVFRLGPAEFYGERARIALRDFKLLDAIAFGRRAIAGNAGNPENYYIVGRAQTLLGERMADERASNSFRRGALANFETALALSPLDKTYAIETALTLDALQRFPEAETRFDEALELDPLSESLRDYYSAHLRMSETGGSQAEQPD